MQPTILITGSSRGLGRAIAELAFKRGYKVIIHGKTDSPQLNQVYSMLPGSIKTYFDISNQKETAEALQNLIKLVGPIPVLVNNAGVALSPGDDALLEDKQALEEYKVNVLGTLHCIQEIAPGMIVLGAGSIINIASVRDNSKDSTQRNITYGASKAALVSVTQSLATLYSPHGIRVNSISPRSLATIQSEQTGQDAIKEPQEATKTVKAVKPEEIASLVLFLASGDSTFITGTNFSVDRS